MTNATTHLPSSTSRESAEREQQVTDRVVDSFETSLSPRFREVIQSLVRHLHAFARDVRLTDEEWMQGIEFLTRVGHITTDRRQEHILLSDVLGLSMLTIGINAPSEHGATESTVFGPFFVEGAPHVEQGADLAGRAKGSPCYVSGTVLGTDGVPVPGARIEVWEADEDGLYDVQRDGEVTAGRGWLRADEEGGFRFWSVRPAPYPIPADGPVGDLLTAGGRSPMRPAHIHFMASAPGYRTLITHVFVSGDPYLDHDAVFGVKESLIADLVPHAAGPAPEGRVLDEQWTSLVFDLVLAPAD